MSEERGARLGEDPNAPFAHAKGELVALKLPDGSADLANVGIIVDGICWYTAPAGAFLDLYVVRRTDGRFMHARGIDLVTMAKKK